MSIAATDKELDYYIGLLDERQKESLLNMIKAFLNVVDDSIGDITIEAYNQELMEAEGEYQRGEYISHEEMKRRAEGW